MEQYWEVVLEEEYREAVEVVAGCSGRSPNPMNLPQFQEIRTRQSLPRAKQEERKG